MVFVMAVVCNTYGRNCLPVPRNRACCIYPLPQVMFSFETLSSPVRRSGVLFMLGVCGSTPAAVLGSCAPRHMARTAAAAAAAVALSYTVCHCAG